MIDQVAPPVFPERAGATLREDIARGDAVVGAAVPILRHLIAAGDLTIFSEEVIARIRAMLADVARQLLDALAGEHGSRGHSSGEIEVVGHALLDNPSLVAHLHAQTLEWQLTDRLYGQLGLDPVASPFLRHLMESPDMTVRGHAMAFLGAQARWCQGQRRMGLALTELPRDLLNVALYTLRTLAGVEPALAERATVVEGMVRRSYNEEATRVGTSRKLLSSLPEAAWGTGLSIRDAGVPMFLTTLGAASGQARDRVSLSTHRSQVTRLVVSLRVAGLDAEVAESQLAVIHPSAEPSWGMAELDIETAAMLLASPLPARGFSL